MGAIIQREENQIFISGYRNEVATALHQIQSKPENQHFGTKVEEIKNTNHTRHVVVTLLGHRD